MIFDYIPITTFLLALTFVVYSVFAKRITEYSVILLTVMSMEMLHLGLTFLLLDLSVNTSLLYEINFLWYFSFAVTNLVAIFVLYKAVKLLKLRSQGMVTPVAALYGVIAVIQIVRYLDRIIIGTDKLGEFYHIAIKLLDASVIGLVFIYLLKEIYVHYKRGQSDNQIY